MKRRGGGFGKLDKNVRKPPTNPKKGDVGIKVAGKRGGWGVVQCVCFKNSAGKMGE